MIQLNTVRVIAAFFLSALFAASPAFAEDVPPTQPASPVQVLDIGEHFFEKQDCKPFEYTESYNECGCKISVKYVQLEGNKTINDLLKPIDDLEKYCDYDYEQGLDAEHSTAWKAVPKEQFTTSIFEYSIQQSASYLSDRWLNVTDYSYVFSGGAHGNTAMDSLLFDLKSNKQVDIATLIDPAKIPAANKEIQNQLNAKPAGEVFEEFLNLEQPSYIKEDSSCDVCVYVLKDSGIYAVFQQYGVGPYSSGFIEVKMPDDVLLESSNIKFKTQGAP